mmetsp:Transcript_9808/g.32710  ORF Transcript_9808/g.32710 Transcript_9808/m.32710 type:complete len:366 (-) Transcript_9808:302-1399(-)
MSDFEAGMGKVQPSAKREGFATVPDVTWADVGALAELREELTTVVVEPVRNPGRMEALGLRPSCGVLLYGPPGCGKSYLASRLAQGLSRRPATLVSGPEIMDKYVGNSEAQLRDLFLKAPNVPARPGDAEDVMIAAEDNELHVIVLDEFDAIARRRSEDSGASSEGGAARDSVVNQLLALMDGVAGLPVPTFVVALTNRRELVDPAVLRPGRLEVQVECGMPEATGRAAILRIHLERMRDSGRLALDGGAAAGGECTLERVDERAFGVWVEGLAAQTEGFSGAAISGLVRAAVARALDRAVSLDNTAGCRVTGADFGAAIADLRSSSLELERAGTTEGGAADADPSAAEQQQQQQQQAVQAVRGS